MWTRITLMILLGVIHGPSWAKKTLWAYPCLSVAGTEQAGPMTFGMKLTILTLRNFYVISILCFVIGCKWRCSAIGNHLWTEISWIIETRQERVSLEKLTVLHPMKKFPKVHYPLGPILSQINPIEIQSRYPRLGLRNGVLASEIFGKRNNFLRPPLMQPLPRYSVHKMFCNIRTANIRCFWNFWVPQRFNVRLKVGNTDEVFLSSKHSAKYTEAKNGFDGPLCCWISLSQGNSC